MSHRRNSGSGGVRWHSSLLSLGIASPRWLITRERQRISLSLGESLKRPVKVDLRMPSQLEVRCFGGLSLAVMAEALDLIQAPDQTRPKTDRTRLVSKYPAA